MKSLYQKKVRNRTITLLFFFTAWLAVIVFRLVQLQVINHVTLKDEVVRQNHDVKEVTPKRSTIFDRSGNILARSIPRPSAFYIPSKDESLNKQYEDIEKLRKTLRLSSKKTASIKKRLKKGESWIWTS